MIWPACGGVWDMSARSAAAATHTGWPTDGYQCAKCRHEEVLVTAGTVLHKTHMLLTQWFLTLYFMGLSTEKRKFCSFVSG